MKLLIATPLYPPDIGGPATYTKALKEQLPTKKIEVTVVNFGDVRHLPVLVRHFVYFLRLLKNGRRADIIYAQDPVSVGLPAYMAARVLRKKFIVKIVGDYAWEQSVQRFGVEELLDDFLGRTYGFRVEMFRSIERFVARAAQKIIVPSHYFGTVVERWGIDSKKIQVIYNDVSTRDVPLRRVARAGLKMRQDEIKFVSVGRLVPWKGFAMLVNIMPKVMETYPKAKLVIIGDGPQYTALKEKISANKLQGNVILLGTVSRENVLRHVRSADIFLLNTAYEGFSHQLLEAFSLSTPVISTDAGGNKEILRDGSNAMIAGYNRPEEWLLAIQRLLADKGFRSALAGKSLEDVMPFLGTRMVDELALALKSL